MAKNRIQYREHLLWLIGLLEDEHLRVKKGAADSIAYLAEDGVIDRKSLAPLRRLLEDEDKDIWDTLPRHSRAWRKRYAMTLRTTLLGVDPLNVLTSLNAAPLVAIIIVSFNRPADLKRAIASAASQTYENIEIIVVDGGSDVDISSVVEEFNDNRIAFIQAGKESDLSISRNIGARHAKADFLSFLDDDDELLPLKIQRQMDIFGQANDDVGLVYCGSIDTFEDGTKNYYPASKKGKVLDDLLWDNFIPCGSVVLRRGYFEIAGGFASAPIEDYDLWLSLAPLCLFECVEDCLFIYHHHSKQMTKQLSRMIDGHIRITQKHRSLFEQCPEAFAAAYYRIGIFYLQAGEKKKSRRYLLKSLDLDKGRLETYVCILLSILPEKAGSWVRIMLFWSIGLKIP